MMTHPAITSKIAEIRYQQLLQEAEAARLYREIKKNNPSLLQRTGKLLSAAGQKLKAQPQLKTNKEKNHHVRTIY